MKLGKSFKIGYIDDDGRFLPLAFAQSASIDMKTTATEVSSPLTGGWVERRPKRNSWSMQHEGLLGSNTINYPYQGKNYAFWALLKKLWRDKAVLTARWQETLPDNSAGDMMQGQCLIEYLKQVASEKALTKVSVKLTGTGELRDLSAEDLTGAFAYSIQGHTLTLYTVSRPIANFSVHAGDTAVGTWDATAAGRTQTFTNDAIAASSVISAWKGDGAAATEQTGITFTDSTTLHVVLLQTDTRDEQQQIVRTVQAIWWGGYAMGKMVVSKTGQADVTLSTAGHESASDAVTPFPFDVLTGDVTIEMPGTPQTLHCIDRTSSTKRTIRATQTRRNADGGAPYTCTASVSPEAFGCAVEVWANDADGNEVMRVIVPQGASYADTNLSALIPDTQHLHFRLDGLGVDDGGPYSVARSLVNDLEAHDVYYAYDAATQVMRIYAPDQRYSTGLKTDGATIYSGLLYATDAQGNRVPRTLTGVASFSTISTSRGTYTFHDVSALTVFNLSNTLAISALPLDDVLLTGAGGTEVGRIPALSDPSSTYPAWQVITVPGSNIAGAQMEAGAAQSLTYHEYSQSVHVKTSATQTGESTWTINIAIRAGDGSPATLPGNLFVKYGSHSSIAILAGQYGTSASVNYDPSWTIPTATLNHPKAADFNIYTAPTPDITAGHWTAYKLGLVDGAYYYDVAYTGGSHPGIALEGGFMYAGTKIASGQQVADALLRATGSGVDNLSIGVRGNGAPEWSAATIEHVSVNTTDKLVLSYRLGEVGSTTVTNLTNIKDYIDGTPVYSRHSCIAHILPFVGVVWRTSTTIYNRVGLEGLKPGSTTAFEAQALYGIYSGDDSAEGVMAVFTNSNDNVIDASGVTGVEVRAVNHGATIFPR